MEEKLNIRTILQQAEGHFLVYSELDHRICHVETLYSEEVPGFPIRAFDVRTSEFLYFNEYGVSSDAEDQETCTLFPSDKMKDWKKLLWKKGDILYRPWRAVAPEPGNDDENVFFVGWAKHDYSRFIATSYDINLCGYLCPQHFDGGGINSYLTNDFEKETEKKGIMQRLRRITVAFDSFDFQYVSPFYPQYGWMFEEIERGRKKTWEKLKLNGKE